MIKENCDPVLGCGQPNILFRPFDIIGGNPPPPPFDPSYQAVINYATSQGYTLPSAANQARQNKLVLDLKAAGIWAALDVFYNFFTDGDANFAKINWLVPGTFQAVGVNAPTYTPLSGFAFDGGTKYLNTGWAPSMGPNFVMNSASMFGYNVAGAADWAWGAANLGVAHDFMQKAGVNATAINSTSSTFIDSQTPSAVGLWQGQRISGNIQTVKDGAVLLNSPVVAVAPTNLVIYIGARNSSGVADLYKIFTNSMWGAGASLTGKEAALYNAWQSYKTNATQPLESKQLLVDTDGSAKGFEFGMFGSLTPDWFEGIPVDKFDLRADGVIELKLDNGFKLPYIDIVRMFIGDEALDLYWNGVDQYEALAPITISSFIVVGSSIEVTLMAVR